MVNEDKKKPAKKAKTKSSSDSQSAGGESAGGVDELQGHDMPRVYTRHAPSAADKKQNSQIWLVSFTDVMALMLTFFVLLFSMSEPENQRFEEMASALNNEFNKYYGAALQRGPVEEINLDRIDYDRALGLDYLSALLTSVLNESEALAGAKLESSSQFLVLSMPQEFLFSPGKATIRDEGTKALYALGGALSRIRNKIEIVGHADPIPMGKDGGPFENNWDLSLARAAEIAGVLNRVGYERDIGIRGLGSSRYQDLEGIADEEKRLALSRRVDILIYNHDGRRNDVRFAPVIR